MAKSLIEKMLGKDTGKDKKPVERTPEEIKNPPDGNTGTYELTAEQSPTEVDNKAPPADAQQPEKKKSPAKQPIAARKLKEARTILADLVPYTVPPPQNQRYLSPSERKYRDRVHARIVELQALLGGGK